MSAATTYSEPSVGLIAGPTALGAVDALRGYAILLVVLVHTQLIALPGSAWLQRAVSEGSRGVQLFFIVSAYTLTRSLLYRIGQSRTGVLYGYAIRRLFRIAPMFYLVIALNLFDLGLAPRYWAPDGLSGAEIVSAVLFLNAWIPNAITSVVDGGWSIAVEANFYIILPLALMAITTRNRAVFITIIAGAIGLLLSAALTRQAQHLGANHVTLSFFKFWLPYQLPAFGLGILLYFRMSMPALQRPGVIWPVLAAVILVFFFVGKDFVLKILCLGVFTLILLENASLALINRFTIFIGKISYSLYFLHFLVIRYMGEAISSMIAPIAHPDLRFGAAFLALVIIAATLASLTWLMVEKPFIRWGGMLAARVERAKAAA